MKEHYATSSDSSSGDDYSDSDGSDPNRSVVRVEQKGTLWEDLNEMRNQLRAYDIQVVKKYISEEMPHEVEAIRDQYYKEFADVPEDDELKFEVLVLLAELGIEIYREPEEESDEPED
jgi:hypothetical protein